jgi:HSP20 family molecular chaperone IbpA
LRGGRGLPIFPLRPVAATGPAHKTVALQKGMSMSKMGLGAYPHMLGFDQLERLLERTAKSGNDGYPPYNIEQTSDCSWRITLAVAGFSERDLSITIEDRQLVVRGRQAEEDEAERVFLHRGIAARQFQRSFVLADGVEVGEALMENGLLHIDLARERPESVVQTISIRKGGAQ